MEDFKEMLKDMITMGGALGIGLGLAFSILAAVVILLHKITGVPIN